MKRILLSILLLIHAATLEAADIAIARIDIVIPNDSANFSDLAKAIQNTLQQQQPGLEITVRNSGADAAQNANTLLIGIGDNLLPWLTSVQNNYAASISFYSSSISFNAHHSNKLSALYRDQPLSRQLRLAKLLIPNLRSAAIVRGRQELAVDAAQLHRRSGLDVEISELRNQPDWVKLLSQLMSDNDVLIGVDDPLIYNSETIRSILLTTYRHGKVLIGPSRPFVTAGSLGSCYTGSEQYLQQLAEMVKYYLQTGKLPPPQYPKLYRIAINPQVASSLGLIIPDEKVLSTRMQNNNEECGDDC